MISPREKLAIILGVITLSILLFYFMLLQPLWLQKQQLQNIVKSQLVSLAWMQQAANTVQAAQQVTIKTKPSILAVIDQSLRQQQLHNLDKRVEPRSDTEVRINFEQIAMDSLLYWLADLEQQHQIKVLLLNLEPNTIMPQVRARITLYYE
jgi:type II secretory pathway component PulM